MISVGFLLYFNHARLYFNTWLINKLSARLVRTKNKLGMFLPRASELSQLLTRLCLTQQAETVMEIADIIHLQAFF